MYETNYSGEKPKIVVSKCLGFGNCRYNGNGEKNKFIENLKNHVEIITVCPEVGIGLPIPRETIRIVQKTEEESKKLIEPKTMRDLTTQMCEFGEEFLGNLVSVDGFILKSRSPSCGIKDVKIYTGEDKSSMCRRGKGLFGEQVIDTYGYLPVEDEGRLSNFKIREHFLTKLYMMKKFREIEIEQSVERLIDFHSRNKLLLMAYSQKYLKALNSILGSYDGRNKRELFRKYKEYLGLATMKAPKYTSNINVLMRSLGYFSDKITHEEKEFILETIERYRQGKVNLGVPIYVIKSYIVRFNEKNLKNQTFYDPFPLELVDISDSGKCVH